MTQVIIAAFPDRIGAEKTVEELERVGFNPKEISVITREQQRISSDTLADDTASGAATGSMVGGLAGLLAGAGVLPALAGLLIGGPIAVALGATGVLATTISGAVTGAVAGGLIGALVHLGVPEDEARYYDRTVEAGGYVIAVPARQIEGEDVRKIFTEHGAEKIDQINLDSGT